MEQIDSLKPQKYCNTETETYEGSRASRRSPSDVSCHENTVGKAAGGVLALRSVEHLQFSGLHLTEDVFT